MNKVHLAIIIPYTKDNKIMLQDRHSISKFGEEWGFWGGSIETGETPLQAAIRETKEELCFDLLNPEYLGRVEKRFKNKELNYHAEAFIYAFLTDENVHYIVKEGDGLKFYTVDEARNLRIIPGVTYLVLDRVEEFLKNK